MSPNGIGTAQQMEEVGLFHRANVPFLLGPRQMGYEFSRLRFIGMAVNVLMENRGPRIH